MKFRDWIFHKLGGQGSPDVITPGTIFTDYQIATPETKLDVLTHRLVGAVYAEEVPIVLELIELLSRHYSRPAQVSYIQSLLAIVKPGHEAYYRLLSRQDELEVALSLSPETTSSTATGIAAALAITLEELSDA